MKESTTMRRSIAKNILRQKYREIEQLLETEK